MIDALLGECEHIKCEHCGMCSGYLAQCPNRANDEQGRVTTDRAGQALHTECRRLLTLGIA